jgi:HrpA-like RNA helicase
MSATAQSSFFQTYFGSLLFREVPCIIIQGRTFPVKEYFLEDSIEKCGYLCEPNSEYSINTRSSGKSSVEFKLDVSIAVLVE